MWLLRRKSATLYSWQRIPKNTYLFVTICNKKKKKKKSSNTTTNKQTNRQANKQTSEKKRHKLHVQLAIHEGMQFNPQKQQPKPKVKQHTADYRLAVFLFSRSIQYPCQRPGRPSPSKTAGVVSSAREELSDSISLAPQKRIRLL